MEETVLEPLKEEENMVSDPPKSSGSTFLYVSACTVNLIAFASGVGFGWASPVLAKLKTDGPENPFHKPIGPMEESLLAGLMLLGATLGPFVSGQMAARVGRKVTLLLAAFPMLTSFLMTAFGHRLQVYYIARLLIGFGAGFVFTVLPAYLSEIAEDRNRGSLGCLMGVFLSMGLLFAYIVGPYTTVKYFNLICTIPLLLFVPIFYFWIPESPPYLISVGDELAAKESLSKLRGTGDVNKEIAEITRNSEGKKGTLGDVFKSYPLRKGLIVTIALMFFQQFAGINVVISYMQTIFASTGGDIPAEASAIIVGVIQFFVTIVTSSVVDRLGRRILFLISSLLSSLSLGTLGLYFYLQTNEFNVKSISWLPVASLIVYIIGFNLGLGPLPWAVLGELFPTHVKAVASTLVSFICFIFASVITFLFPPLSLIIGKAQSFWLFSVITAGCTCFVYLFVPETKGKTIQEILEILGAPKKT